MSAEAHAIPDDIRQTVDAIFANPISFITEDVAKAVVAKAINDAVMADRERCAEICVARSKEHAASRHQWKDSDSVNLCLSDSIEALNCASAIRAAPKAEGK